MLTATEKNKQLLNLISSSTSRLMLQSIYGLMERGSYNTDERLNS
jgi:hypothetical protein